MLLASSTWYGLTSFAGWGRWKVAMRFAMYETNARSASLNQLAASDRLDRGAVEGSQAASGCRGVMDASASANSMRATAISWSDCSPIQNSALVPK